jgi:predicted  nucleic acid-binding Zn-ribbon protein
MTQLTTDRYIQVCRAFVKLADKFQQLDVEHMTLKTKVVPILKLLKKYKETAEALSQKNEVLSQKNEALEQALQAITERYESLKLFEVFLEPDFQALLQDAEDQLALVDETLQEMETDRDPDLDDLDKTLLLEYQNQPETFEARLAVEPANHAAAA